MKPIITILFLCMTSFLMAQTGSVKGQLQDPQGAAVEFGNVALYSATDSTMVKVETSDLDGVFDIRSVPTGNYFLEASMLGFANLVQTNIAVTANEQTDLEVLTFAENGIDLEGVTVTATRALVEVKADRTVFNVEGTINSVGEDGISLLRKAPGVLVDNNDNINVLGRSGVLVYVDGKRLPLGGTDLADYLKNLSAEQIDRIDIISNPGAKYEAEGNAGIIDIRLKRDKNLGANGSVSATYSRGQYSTYNVNSSANYRNKVFNAFGTLGYADKETFNEMDFINYQNDLFTVEKNHQVSDRVNTNFRFGTDFFLGKKHTLGFLVGGNFGDNIQNGANSITLAREETMNQIDSILISDNVEDKRRTQNTYNINYRYDIGKTQSLNIDLDYGQYGLESERFQPNRYYEDASRDVLLTENINTLNTPTDIGIYTAKIDYEQELLGGQLSFGTKLSRVISENTFLFYDEMGGESIRNDNRSNQFDYEENVYAGYINFARPINQKWGFSAGIRAEQTDATGDLQTFLVGLEEPPVELNYLQFFPSIGLTWNPARVHSFNLNYGKRINRPDYNVLNPFDNQLTELSSQKGNPNLQPEIVNNMELGYTWQYRYNFKLAYSLTENQITRLIELDEDNEAANSIRWENLDEQHILSFNASLPVQMTEKWSAYYNLGASHIDNQATYENGGVVDVQAFSYSIYMQHTIDLPAKLKGEVSGYFAGPGVWGGVFQYQETWSLNLGLQRKFLQDKLNVKLAANDIFYQSGWNGFSEFNGLRSEGMGNYDSRRVSLSLSYRFGNDKVKSRKRKTGLEEEGSRVGG